MTDQRKSPSVENEDDILLFTAPEGIPGALFNGLTAVIFSNFKHRGCSRKRAQYVAVQCIEATMNYYQAVAAAEDG